MKATLFNKIIILNHIKREKEGLALKKILETEAKPLGIEVEICFDDGSFGLWENYKRALRLESKGETFRFIIHDDMYINRKIIKKILHILNYAPQDIITFYNPSNKGYKGCLESGKHILKTYTNFWLQCTAFPINLIEPYIHHGDSNFPKEYKWEDRRLVSFCNNFNIPVYSVVPSLVQHLGAFRSTFGITGKIGNYIRASATYDAEFDVYKHNWVNEFNNPFISNVTINDKFVETSKKMFNDFYGV